MRPEEIRVHVRKQPFDPIRVHISDGSYYDVIHHDFMLISQREVIIGLFSSQEKIPDKKVYIDPIHITRIEPIDVVSTKWAKEKPMNGGLLE